MSKFEEIEKDNWYKITLYDNYLTKDNVVMVFDSRRLYEIEYGNGNIDLVRITSNELCGVHCTSFLSDIGEDRKFKIDMVDLVKNGKVRETDYIITRFQKDFKRI